MSGWVLTGHGGPEELVWRDDLPLPRPGPGEVLIAVSASSVNNTDINTRIGWYAKAVRGDTGSGATAGVGVSAEADGSWAGTPMRFPRIQGADCCGEIAEVGSGVARERIGERVLVRTLQTTGAGDAPLATWTFGSECDGAFATYAKAFAADALPVHSAWSDLELATIPCAFSTAEGMVQRAAVGCERVLVTGASGGVGSAAVQLAHRRGAEIVAMAGTAKHEAVRALGASEVLARDATLRRDEFDVVIDLVAGPRWPAFIDALRRGGRYVTAGAIAGPIVELDVRTLYLRDLTLLGATWQAPNILPDLIGYIERDEIRPTVAATYPLLELKAAQAAFLDKRYVGKIALDVTASAA